VISTAIKDTNSNGYQIELSCITNWII